MRKLNKKEENLQNIETHYSQRAGSKDLQMSPSKHRYEYQETSYNQPRTVQPKVRRERITDSVEQRPRLEMHGPLYAGGETLFERKWVREAELMRR